MWIHTNIAIEKMELEKLKEQIVRLIIFYIFDLYLNFYWSGYWIKCFYIFNFNIGDYLDINIIWIWYWEINIDGKILFFCVHEKNKDKRKIIFILVKEQEVKRTLDNTNEWNFKEILQNRKTKVFLLQSYI